MNRYVKLYKDSFIIFRKIHLISGWNSLLLIVSLITSFIGIIFDLKTIEQLTFLIPTLSNLNKDASTSLLLFLTFFSCSAIVRLITILILERSCAKIGSDLSIYICRNTFLNNISEISESDITSRLTTEIQILINGVIIPLFLSSISLLQIISILTATIILKGIFSVIVLLILGTLYFLFFQINNKKLKLIDKEQNKIRRELLEIIRVLYLGSEELKTYFKTENYLKSFSQKSYRLYQNDSLNKILAQYPKYIIEFLGPLVIFIFIGYLNIKSNSDNENSILALLFLVGFLAQKLLPPIQLLYSQLTALKSYQIIFKRIYSNLKDPYWSVEKKEAKNLKIFDSKNASKVKELVINKWIHFQTNLSLKNPLTFKSGEITSIKGSSGIGKTIFLKSLLGFEDSQIDCKIRFFDKDNDINYSNSNIIKIFETSYLPQKPIVLSGSIKENINLGLKNQNKFIHHLAIDFLNIGIYGIFKSNKNISINSRIGPQGLNLSGGQIQRIGLARTFANGSKIVLLDEPSSALDKQSEDEMLELIRNYVHEGNIIIIISHSENVHKFADKVFDFSKELSNLN